MRKVNIAVATVGYGLWRRTVHAGSEEELWAFLTSNELWGGAGSLADQALMRSSTRTVDRQALERLLVDTVAALMKRADLARVKSTVEMDLMRRIKASLDPKGILNPGKVL
jgi:hypothetical protein